LKESAANGRVVLSSMGGVSGAFRMRRPFSFATGNRFLVVAGHRR
jgi:hypothetical protein